MKCCMKCDQVGKLFPTGLCVDPYDIDSECPLSNCNERLIAVDSPIYADSHRQFARPISIDPSGTTFANDIPICNDISFN